MECSNGWIKELWAVLSPDSSWCVTRNSLLFKLAGNESFVTSSQKHPVCRGLCVWTRNMQKRELNLWFAESLQFTSFKLYWAFPSASALLIFWALDLRAASHSRDAAVGVSVQRCNLPGFNLPVFFFNTTSSQQKDERLVESICNRGARGQCSGCWNEALGQFYSSL